VKPFYFSPVREGIIIYKLNPPATSKKLLDFDCRVHGLHNPSVCDPYALQPIGQQWGEKIKKGGMPLTQLQLGLPTREEWGKDYYL